MKPILKIRTCEEGLDYFPSSPRKDMHNGLIKIVCCLVIFMAGTVLGLSVSSRLGRYFTTQTELFFPRSMYTVNCDSNGLVMHNFITPSHLMHTLNDEELFWRASMVPRKDKYPFVRVQKVAFMFLTRGPLPFIPLWDKFFIGHEGLYSIYVHTIPSYKLNVSRTSSFYGRQIPSEEVTWGSIRLVDAERRLLANALLDFHNERFVLLSESCIPVYNFPTIYEYLTNSKHSFVESYDEDSWVGRGRYNKHMAPDITLADWRKGAEWFEVSRDIAIDIVAEQKYYNLFRQYCKPPCYSDEHYIPTYMYMFHGALTANRTLTWVDWSRGGPHPARYGAENITETFIQKIRNNDTRCLYNDEQTSTCYLFARKFAPNALRPLLNISSKAMNF